MAMNLDLDFIDYPTGWAIQKAGLTHEDPRCSAEQTGGAMLCDCKALPRRWAQLKGDHIGDHSRARELARPYFADATTTPTPTERESAEESHG